MTGMAALAFVAWAYFPAVSKYRDLSIQEDHTDKELADLDAKIRALNEEREQLADDPEYLERVIRTELGLVKPGEIVYKFVEQPENEPVDVPDAQFGKGTVLDTAKKPVAKSR